MLMQCKSSNLIISFTSLACVLTLAYPSASHAGFEWTPPARIQPETVQPTNPNQNQTQDTAGPLTPELTEGTNENLPVPVGNVEQAPIQSSEIVATPEPQTAPATEVTQTTDLPVIEGFGKDIPLAIALRDIVPSNFAYAFNPREIAGTKISWRGGKAWPEVLQNALSQYNLDSVVNGNNITIFAKQSMTNTPAVAPIAAEQTSPAVADPVPLVEPMPSAAPEPQSEPPVAAEKQTANTIPVVDLKHHKKWTARPGATLRETLESWSKSAGTEINWSTPYDYPISNAFYFEGNFSDAVESLLSSYGGESPSPKGRLYPNLPDGPSVLMIN